MTRTPESSASARPSGRQLGQSGLVVILAALVLLSSRDAARAELRDCGRLFVGVVSDVMTGAPHGVKAVAAVLAAVARDLSVDPGTNRGVGLVCPPLPPTWQPWTVEAEAACRVASSGARPLGGAPLRPTLHDLPPPRA